MGTRTKFWLGVAAVLAATFTILAIQADKINRLTEERDRYKGNTESLLSDVETYRTKDSLSAARVQSLELTVKEYERFRASDAELIKSLKAKNRNLAAVNKTQSETIISLYAMPRDTIVIRDSIPVQAKAVHCGDEWYDFDGIMTDRDFTGTLTSRDSLMIVESVKYKRFLGFLWYTNKVEDRQMDCVSKNPHNNIVGLEYIVLEK